MGTSFTEFRGDGFWARDVALQVWLRFLTEEVDRSRDVPEWLKKARDHWDVQATYGFTGCMWAGLNEYITDDTRRAIVEALAVRALEQLRRQGSVLRAEFLNSLRFDPEAGIFTDDVEAAPFIRVGEQFLDLLHGQLTSDASSG